MWSTEHKNYYWAYQNNFRNDFNFHNIQVKNSCYLITVALDIFPTKKFAKKIILLLVKIKKLWIIFSAIEQDINNSLNNTIRYLLRREKNRSCRDSIGALEILFSFLCPLRSRSSTGHKRKKKRMRRKRTVLSEPFCECLKNPLLRCK